MKRLGLIAILVCSLGGCGKGTAIPEPWSDVVARLTDRYGPVSIRTVRRDTGTRLDLTLSDRRYHGKWPGFTDTAKAVARTALAALGADHTPDSITVTITTSDLNLLVYRRTTSQTERFSVASLQAGGH